MFRDEKLVARRKMQYRPDSIGIYEAELDPFEQTGRYRVELESEQARQVLAENELPDVETEFKVRTTDNPVELSELTVDRGLLGKTARLSGGAVSGPGGADALVERFGPGSRTIKERREKSLWDSWQLLLLLLGCIAGEWLLRRRAGLP